MLFCSCVLTAAVSLEAEATHGKLLVGYQLFVASDKALAWLYKLSLTWMPAVLSSDRPVCHPGYNFVAKPPQIDSITRTTRG